MSNTSATGGYLLPLVPPAPTPLQGIQLYRFFHDIVMGLTGLPAGSVRPAWQPIPPQQPDASVDWCGLRVTVYKGDTYPAIVHVGTGDGYDMLIRHEQLSIFASFYGPNAQQNAAVLREGFFIWQNREVLKANAMGLTEVDEVRTIPDLVNNQWIERCDVEITIKREIVRNYAVLNLESAAGQITSNDGLVTPFDAEPST